MEIGLKEYGLLKENSNQVIPAVSVYLYLSLSLTTEFKSPKNKIEERIGRNNINNCSNINSRSTVANIYANYYKN